MLTAQLMRRRLLRSRIQLESFPQRNCGVEPAVSVGGSHGRWESPPAIGTAATHSKVRPSAPADC